MSKLRASYRTSMCGALRPEHVNQDVRLSGWLHRKRDHGGLLFVDMRDHTGLIQLVVEPENPHFSEFESLRVESVMMITGQVAARTSETVNKNLPTGDVEIRVETLEVLNPAQELPLPVFGEPDYPENIRLAYRYLDLRRESLHHRIVQRSQIIASLRRRMIEQGFLEFQTPILTASSPEGARDFLVPSRLNPGRFYALPQAPQQFKQLIMMAGFDKYFQIAPCFRDEDARADRSPGEFYQLDMEMSFVEQDDVFSAIEPVLHGVFEEFSEGRTITPAPFPRISYQKAMLDYGTDKPDLRIPLICSDVTQFFAEESVSFKAFQNLIAKGGVVRAIPAPQVGGQPRSFFDKLNAWAQTDMQAPGLGYILFEQSETGLKGKGPIAKFIPENVLQAMAAHAGVGAGDALFFAAGSEKEAVKLTGAAREKIGHSLDLVEKNVFRFCWIVDFPMYEWDEEEKKIIFSHNPFSMPQGGIEALESKDPLEILAWQYDIVCNGIELSSGALRNHRPDIMLKAFEIAGYTQKDIEEQFGGMWSALHYGAPPHGGIAPGVDRIVMLLAGVDNIREVVLFPMNQQAQDLMMQAPSDISEQQLKELSLRLALPLKED